MIKGFSRWVRKLVHRGQHNYCVNCLQGITDFHHRLSNTKTNRRLFPLFIDSIFNICGLCRYCHSHKSHLFHINHDMAMAYEEYLALFATVWYNIGNKEGHYGKGELSVQELRQREDLRKLAEKALSKSG